MNSIEIDETYWGRVQYFSMPLPDIYLVSSEKNEGYVIPQNYAGNILSSKALQFGTEHEGLLYFPSGESMCVVEYELLCHQRKSCCGVKAQEVLQEQLVICKQYGQVDLPEYFGKYPPPRQTPQGIVEALHKVCNGIYFVRTDEQWLFCVCYPIATSELTILAQKFGELIDDYLIFGIPTCAIPIFELQNSYPLIEQHVKSQHALYALLWNNFSTYVTLYNDDVNAEQYQIPRPLDDTIGQDFLCPIQ